MFGAILALMLLTGATWAQPGETAISSPDGQLKFTFQTLAGNQPAADGGKLVYTVSFHGRPLIEASALGLDLTGQPLLGANVRIVNNSFTKADQTYHLITGKAGSVRNHFNAVRMELQEPGGPARKL